MSNTILIIPPALINVLSIIANTSVNASLGAAPLSDHRYFNLNVHTKIGWFANALSMILSLTSTSIITFDDSE